MLNLIKTELEFVLAEIVELENQILLQQDQKAVKDLEDWKNGLEQDKVKLEEKLSLHTYQNQRLKRLKNQFKKEKNIRHAWYVLNKDNELKQYDLAFYEKIRKLVINQ